MPVHPVATRGFGDAAESYERARPSYPPAAVAHLVEHLGIDASARVCDLAAGTGKLTRLLVGTGASLLAVEPVAGMRDVLQREMPSVSTVAAVAEALPLADEGLDAVVVAQAFHWFDAPTALAEIHRVLRPGGRLGLLWNAWDGTVPWIHRIHRIVANVDATAEWTRGHGTRDWVTDAIRSHGDFGPVERAHFTSTQPLTPDGVVERVATTSHIASAPDAERSRTLDAVRAVLATDPATRHAESLNFAYEVDLFWCARP